MLKKLGYMLCGALLAAVVGTAYATIGTAPGTGPALQDGTWLNGLASGFNNVAKTGVAAAGGAQASATQLASQIRFFEVDTATVTTATGIALPPAIEPGITTSVFNNTSVGLTLFPSISNNTVTAAQDTINNGTSTPISALRAVQCFAAQAGRWSCQ